MTVNQDQLKNFLENVFEHLKKNNLVSPADKDKTIQLVLDSLQQMFPHGIHAEQLNDKKFQKQLSLVFAFVTDLQNNPRAAANPQMLAKLTDEFAKLMINPENKSTNELKPKLFRLLAEINELLDPNKKLGYSQLKHFNDALVDKASQENTEDKEFGMAVCETLFKMKPKPGAKNRSLEEEANRNMYGGKDPTLEDSLVFPILQIIEASIEPVIQGIGAGGDLSGSKAFDNVFYDSTRVDYTGSEAKTREALVALGDTLESALEAVEHVAHGMPRPKPPGTLPVGH